MANMNKIDLLQYFACSIRGSYGQHFQDLFALWESGFKFDGYFVEFGALNGITASNTYLLERLGWDGIVAEPHPDYHQILKERRQCNVSTDCVWDATGKEVKFKAVIGKPALSTVKSVIYDDIQEQAGNRENYIEHTVPTISLLDLLEHYNAPENIDFLSIDTEGSELQILSAFDFSKYRVNIVVVEHGFSSTRDEIYALLNANGYERMFVEYSEHDDWYVLKDYQPTMHIPLEQAVEKIIAECNDVPTEHYRNRVMRLATLAKATKDQKLIEDCELLMQVAS